MAFSEASHTPENVIQQAEREARLKHLVKELFELDESDLASLRERIEKNSGRIELLIHPFFEKHHISRDDYDLRDEESKLVEEYAHHLVRNNNLEAAPLIIMEEGRSIGQTREILAEDIEESETPLYYIETSNKSPKPASKGKYKPADNSRRKFPAFAYLAERLKELGVSHIQISGMYLNSLPKEFEYENKSIRNLGGCVGVTVQQLHEDFEIEISDNTYPSKGSEVQQFVPKKVK